jgi:phosphate transport system substrate-binding protein
MAQDLDYVPMPQKVVGAIKKSWSMQIKDKDGKPLMALSN